MQLGLSLQGQGNLLLLQNLGREIGKLLQAGNVNFLVIEVGEGLWFGRVDLWHLEGHELVLGNGSVGDNENGHGEAIQCWGEETGVVEDSMLSEDHGIGGWLEELKVGELETGFVYILLRNSGETSICPVWD